MNKQEMTEIVKDYQIGAQKINQKLTSWEMNSSEAMRHYNNAKEMFFNEVGKNENSKQVWNDCIVEYMQAQPQSDPFWENL